MPTPREKAERFRRLHERDGAFVIPNPWDAGSARLLEAAGFEALATSSAAFAWTLGRLDGRVGLEEKLAHCRALCAATGVPVSADLENGFGDAPDAVAETILRAAETGLAGGSIEDFSGSADRPIYELEYAVARIRAAADAARRAAVPFVLTARAENFLHGRPDLEDTIGRLRAYEEAGADVLYAPGLRTLAEVRRVTAAVSRPVNVLGVMVAGASVADLEAAGAKRISVGGALARAALGGMLRAASDLGEGGFGWLADAASGAEIARALGETPDPEPTQSRSRGPSLSSG